MDRACAPLPFGLPSKVLGEQSLKSRVNAIAGFAFMTFTGHSGRFPISIGMRQGDAMDISGMLITAMPW